MIRIPARRYGTAGPHKQQTIRGVWPQTGKGSRMLPSYLAMRTFVRAAVPGPLDEAKTATAPVARSPATEMPMIHRTDSGTARASDSMSVGSLLLLAMRLSVHGTSR